MTSFLQRKTQSELSTKSVIFSWQEATGQPERGYTSTLVLSEFQSAPAPPATPTFPTGGTRLRIPWRPFNSLQLQKPLHGKREHFLAWGSPDTFPNPTSEQRFGASELCAVQGSGERKTALTRVQPAPAWAPPQCPLSFWTALKSGPALTEEPCFAGGLHLRATISSKIWV